MGEDYSANIWNQTRRVENEDVRLKKDVDELKEGSTTTAADIAALQQDVIDEQINEANEPLVPVVKCFFNSKEDSITGVVSDDDPLSPDDGIVLLTVIIIPLNTTVVKVEASVTVKETAGFKGDVTLRLRCNGVLEQLKWRETVQANARATISGVWQLDGLALGPNDLEIDVIIDGALTAAMNVEDRALLSQVKFNIQT